MSIVRLALNLVLTTLAFVTLSCEHDSLAPQGHRLEISTNFTTGSRFSVESLPFNSLRKAQTIRATLEQKFTFYGPSTQRNSQLITAQGSSNNVFHSVAVFRSRQNQRFAVHDEDPSPELLKWYSGLRTNEEYTFPRDAHYWKTE